MTAAARLPAGHREHPLGLHAPAVESLWSFRAERATRVVVLPDGRCDPVLTLESDPGGTPHRLDLWVAGLALRAREVPLADGSGCVALRFRPGWTPSLLSLRGHGLIGVSAEAADLLRIPGAAQPLLRPAASEDLLLRRLRGFAVRAGAVAPPGGLREHLHALDRSGGVTPVGAAARRGPAPRGRGPHVRFLRPETHEPRVPPEERADPRRPLRRDAPRVAARCVRQALIRVTRSPRAVLPSPSSHRGRGGL